MTANKKNKEILKKFRDFTKDSTMSEEDALRLSKGVSLAVANRYKEMKK